MSAPRALHSAAAGECRRAMCCIPGATHVGAGSDDQHRPCRWLSKEGRGSLEAVRRHGAVFVARWVGDGGGSSGVHAASTDRRLASRTFLPSPMERPSPPVQPCQRRPCFTLPCSRLSVQASPHSCRPRGHQSACFFLSNPAAVPREVASFPIYAGVVLRAETVPLCLQGGLATRPPPSASWS
jgi:hypothetical protein